MSDFSDDIVVNLSLRAEDEASAPIARLGTAAEDSATVIEAAARRASLALDTIASRARTDSATVATSWDSAAQRLEAYGGQVDSLAGSVARLQGAFDTIRGTAMGASTELSAVADQARRAEEGLGAIGDTATEAKMGLHAVGDEGEYAASMLARTSGGLTELSAMAGKLSAAFETAMGRMQAAADRASSVMTGPLATVADEGKRVADSLLYISQGASVADPKIYAVRDALVLEADAAKRAADQQYRLNNARDTQPPLRNQDGAAAQRTGGTTLLGTPRREAPSAPERGIGAAAPHFGKAASEVSDAAFYGGLGGLFIGYEAVKKNAEYQQQLARLQGFAGSTPQDVALYSRFIDQNAVPLATKPTDIASELYWAVSGGRRGRQATETVKYSSMAATADIAPPADVEKALEYALNTFGSKATPADIKRTSDELSQTVVEGMQSYADLARALARPLAVAPAARASLPDVLALEATLTQHGYSSRFAGMNIASLERSFMAPSEGQIKTASALGYNPAKLFDNRGPDGLIDTIKRIYNAAVTSDPTIAELAKHGHLTPKAATAEAQHLFSTNERIRSLTGNQAALATVLSMGADHFQGLDANLYGNRAQGVVGIQNAAGAYGGEGVTQHAFGVAEKTPGFGMRQTGVLFNQDEITIGKDLDKELKEVLHDVNDFLRLVQHIPKGWVEFLAQASLKAVEFGLAFKALKFVGSPLLEVVRGIDKLGVFDAAGALIKGLGGALASAGRAAGAFVKVYGEAFAGFIADSAKAVVSTVADAVKISAAWVAEMAKTSAALLRDGAQALGSFAASSAKTALSTVADAATVAGGWVAQMAKTSASLLKDGVQALSGLVVQSGRTAAAAVADAATTAGAWAVASARTIASTIAEGAAWIAFRGLQLASAAATGIMTAAQWALNIALDANPIGLVVVAIIALVAGFKLAYDHIGPFHDAVNAAFGLLKQFAGWITGTLVPGITGAFTGVLDWLKSNWKTVLVSVITGPFAPLALLFAAGGKDWMGKIVTAVEGEAGHLKDALVKAVEGALSAAGTYIQHHNPFDWLGSHMPTLGLGGKGGGGFAGSYASGPNNLSPSMATLGFNAPFYDSGQEAGNYQMFGGLGIPYNGALLDWDYATSPHAVRLPPGQYRYGGQYSQKGMGTFEYFNTPNGGDIGFNHLQATPGFKPGQELRGGTTIGISGEPTSSQFGSGWHLCIVTDASGRAYLKWLTGADMENLSRGQAGGFAGGGGMSGAADPLQAHLGGPVTGHEPRGTSPVSVRVVESVPQLALGSGRFAGTESLIKQQGYAPYVTNPDQAGTYFAREGSTDIPALAAELKRLPPEIAKPLASQLGKIAGEWDAAGRSFNTGLATEDTRHQQALQAIHDRYGNREQALLDKYQISDGTAKAGFLLHESANYAKAQEDQRHTLAKYNIDQSAGNETYLAKQSGIYSRSTEDLRRLQADAAAHRSTDSAAERTHRLDAIRHEETVSTQAIATLATTLGISQTKAKAILDEDLQHRQVVSQQAINTLAGELHISRTKAKAMLEEALKTSAANEALANQKENESHQRHIAGLTQALENHVNSLHIKLSQLGKTIAADLDPSKLWGEVGQQLATNAQKYADTGSALEYALAQGQGTTETTYHPLTAAQRAANRQSEVNGGGPVYQPGAPTTTNLTAAELATVITSAITTRGQVDDRTLATDRFNASVDLGSGDLAAFGKDLADESSIISREGLQRALAGQSYSEQIDTLRALAAQQRTAQTSLDGWDAIVSASTGTLSDMEKAGQSLATDIQGTWERALLDGADGASQLQQQLVLAAQAEADVTTAKNLEAAYLGEITGSAAELDAGLKGLLSTASDKISFWTDMVGRAGTVASAAAGSIGQLATTAIAAAQNLGSLPDIIAGLKNTADQTLTAGETEFARTGQISPGTVSAFDAAHGAETGATADKSFADLAMYQSAGDITDYYKSLGEALPLLAQNVTDTANKFGTASTQYQQAEAAYQNASNEYAGLGTWIQNDGNLTKLHTVTVGESSSAIADNSAKYTQASAAIAAFQSGGITPAEAALKPLTVTIHSTDVTLGQVQTALTTVQGDLTVLGNDALAAGAALGTLASAALAAASGEGAAAAAAWQAAAAQGSDGSSGPGTMAAGQHIPGLAGVLYQAAANGTSAALGGTGATGPGTSVIGQTIPGLAGVLYQAGTTGTAALQFTAPTAATGSPAYAQGYEAGSNGQNPSTNPYPVTTQQGYDYAQGVQDGLTAYNSRGTQPTSPTGVAPQIPAVPTADTGTSVNGGTTGAPALTPVSPVDVQSAANIGGGAASAAGLDTTASVPALGTGAPRGATTTAKSVGATPFFAQHAAGPSADDLYAAEQHRLTGVPGTLTIMGHQFATINGVPQIPASLLTQVVNGQTQTMTGGQFVNGLLAQGSQFLSQYYSGGVSTALPAGANGSDATLGADGRYVAGASGTLSPAQMSWNAELANAAVNPAGLNGWSPVVGPQGPALFQPSTPGSKDGTLDQWGFPIYSPDGTGQYSGLSRGMMETATSDWPLRNLLGGGSYSQVAQQSQQTALLQQIASSTAATAASTGQMVTIGGFLVDNTNPADARERVMSYLQYMQQLFGQLKQLDAAQAGMQVGRSLDWEQMMAHIAGAGAIFGAVALNP